jgi:outer membrane lipoprotein SlyB
MKTRILIGTGVLAAFLGGALFGGVARPALTNAFAGDEAVMEQERPVLQRRAAPAARRVVYSEPEYRAVRDEPHVRRRSTEKQVLIVAGSSGAGAAIGGLAGGGKGAGIGAIVGAVGGLIYNEHTKEKRNR